MKGSKGDLPALYASEQRLERFPNGDGSAHTAALELHGNWAEDQDKKTIFETSLCAGFSFIDAAPTEFAEHPQPLVPGVRCRCNVGRHPAGTDNGG
jgi:hypothetical protein